MKPPRLPDPRLLLAGLAGARADGGAVPAPEELLRELERRLQWRARQSRERRLRKLMGAPEPPERALTVRAMEQIRHLRRAFPEEWPDGRLARGFGVTPEEIRRVLKSRFRPSPERALKQDARLAARPAPSPPAAAAGSALPGPAWPPGPRRCPPGAPPALSGALRLLRPGGARGSPWPSGEGRAKGAARPPGGGGREGPRREEGESRRSPLRPRPGRALRSEPSRAAEGPRASRPEGRPGTPTEGADWRLSGEEQEGRGSP